MANCAKGAGRCPARSRSIAWADWYGVPERGISGRFALVVMGRAEQLEPIGIEGLAVCDEPVGDDYEPDVPPDLDPGAAYFLEEPELIRIRDRFLEAIRREAPEVLASLRDDVSPLIDPRRPRAVDPVMRWAERFHLCKDVGGGGGWLVRAARDTLDHWGRSPDAVNPPRWSPKAALPGSASLPDHLLVRARMATGRFRFEAPAWDQRVETRKQYVRRARLEFDGRLRAELDRFESMFRAEELRKPPRGTNDRHFKWLVLYQIKVRSYQEIADEDGVKKQTVARAVKTTARLLIGESWKDWLRPALRGGAPPADPRRSSSH